MKKHLHFIGITICTTLLMMLISSCNTSKNTASTRFWKGFKTRYNTYYNGKKAYDEGMDAKRTGIKDNFLDPLPLLMAGNEEARALGSGNFETTVKKCEKAIQLYSIHTKPIFKRGKKLTPKDKALKQQTEFNPFIHNAWMLMGLAQLQKGDFTDAAATFAYTSRLFKTNPQVQNTARALQAICYIEMKWYYDAEDLLDKIRRDGIPKESLRYYNMALADLNLHRQNWKEALPYLQKEVKEMRHGVEKARGKYLLSQVYKLLDMKKEAYNALSQCMRQNPPYEMKFNAQVAQTEVFSSGGSKGKLARLKAMSRKANNKDYLDRIYYAIGNTYMSIPDTAKAIEAYESGKELTSRNSIAKSMLLLSLGDIYWDMERFSKAQDCYKGAISALKKDHERFNEIQQRSEILKKLAPHTEEIFVQDSLQALTRMSEKDRMAVIDRMIAIEKQRQKEAEKARKDSIAQARQQENAQNASNNGMTDNSDAASANKKTSKGITPGATGENTAWYFYDQNTVNQGMELFKKQWGKRENVDNWRLSNMAQAMSPAEKAIADSIKAVKEAQMAAERDSLKQNKKKKKQLDDNDPTNKLGHAYYLAQLPLTEEQLAESNKKIESALFAAGVIEMDELENYKLAHKTLTRLYNNFPSFQPKDQLLYKLFLMELHWGDRNEAEIYKQALVDSFPENPYTAIITDPYFEEKAKYGKHMEDSIYAEAYNAFRNNDFETLERNCEISDNKYPQGANRGKFLFLEAMTSLRKGNIKEFAIHLDSVTQYKDDKISEIAKNILAGIKDGKLPVGGEYNMTDLWESRQSLVGTSAADSLLNDSLTPTKDEPFTFILSYNPKIVEEGKLLYNISKFNFTTFAIRNFDLSIVKGDTINQMRVEGFANFDEVHRYSHELYKDAGFKTMAKQTRPILISDHNKKLIGTKYTWEEYQVFYNKNYVPSAVRKELNLDIDPGKFIWDEFEEVKEQKSEEENEDIQTTIEDGSDWY